MSDNWLIIVPSDPLAIPPLERRTAAFELLRALRPNAHDRKVHVYETPIFFDCSGNFESVFCPFCAADILNAWSDEMDLWWKRDHRSLAMETPCCKRLTSLNDLDYVLPQAFACLGIELLHGGPDLEPAERQQVEAALGAPVRIVWRHI